MQSITTQASDKSLELAVRTQYAVMDFVEDVVRRLKDPRGQTVVEYAGILAFVGVIFAALFATPLKSKIGDWVNKVINEIDKGIG
jgi:Flp pilus assembly pilin Flp